MSEKRIQDDPKWQECKRILEDTTVSSSALSDGLVAAIKKYKTACDAAKNCTSLILSSGVTREAAKLMDDMEEAKAQMFEIVGN